VALTGHEAHTVRVIAQRGGEIDHNPGVYRPETKLATLAMIDGLVAKGVIEKRTDEFGREKLRLTDLGRECAAQVERADKQPKRMIQAR
jgi:hypothetical protein